jgi:hypothetical protein
MAVQHQKRCSALERRAGAVRHGSCIPRQIMSIDDLWYKNAVIYCLDVEKYQDANGDGVGDFEGLMRRLDYLQGLGVNVRMAAAVLSFAQPRQRIRRRRFLRRARQARIARRFRRLHAPR